MVIQLYKSGLLWKERLFRRKFWAWYFSWYFLRALAQKSVIPWLADWRNHGFALGSQISPFERVWRDLGL
jgi:hypothetical protein